MYRELDEQILLGSEAIVQLDPDDFAAEEHEWGSDPGDALDAAERAAWTRHATRAAGFGAAAVDDDAFDSSALTDAVRRVMDMSWE
jgi:hypothetical protein